MLIASKLHWIKQIGYHQQKNENYEYQIEKWEDYFQRNGYNDYNEPMEYFPTGNCLGKIGIIPADKKETKINYETAEEILKRFVGNRNQKLQLNNN